MIETEKLRKVAQETAGQRCIDPACGARFALKAATDTDPEALRAVWTGRLASFAPRDRSGVWRYRELLPFASDAPIVTLAEGNTPLYDAPVSAAYCELETLTL